MPANSTNSFKFRSSDLSKRITVINDKRGISSGHNLRKRISVFDRNEQTPLTSKKRNQEEIIFPPKKRKRTTSKVSHAQMVVPGAVFQPLKEHPGISLDFNKTTNIISVFSQL